MKREDRQYTSLRSLTDAYGITKEYAKYTQQEMLDSLKRYVDGVNGRIESAKRIYRQQQAELESLKSPELWAFKAPNHIPPEYRAEYLQRLKNGIGEKGVKLAIRKDEQSQHPLF